MFSLFLSPLWNSPYHPSSPCFMRVFPPHPSTPTSPPLHYNGISSLHRTKGLFSLWWYTRPFSATYEAGAMFSALSTVWYFSTWSYGGSGWFILLFFLWDCKPLQLLHTFSSSSIRDPVLSPNDGWEHSPLYFQALEEPLRRQLYQVPLSQHFFEST